MESRSPRRDQRGFTLVELLVSVAVLGLIMGATLAALSDAYRANESAREVSGLSNNLRVGADLIVRDFIQVGQGLPTGRLVQVAAGGSFTPINRPAPPSSPCAIWPAGTTEIRAVTVGPGCGPFVNGAATDIVTTIAGDTTFDHVPLATGASGINVAQRKITIALPGPDPTGTLPLIDPRGVDISNGGPDDIRPGDLIMLTKGDHSALLEVTSVDGAQTITFASGDPMNLNQFGASGVTGTLDVLAAAAPVGGTATEATRIRMMTYYLDNTITPGEPRLMRRLNWGDPLAPPNQRARTVAFDIENLQFTYDLIDGVVNPANVRMEAADLGGTGACAPNPCMLAQIRKINVFLGGRSGRRFTPTGDFFRNSLTTQVSLRSLALVDRYR